MSFLFRTIAVVLTVLVSAVWPSAALGQQGVAAASTAGPRPVASAAEVTDPPVIDGVLDLHTFRPQDLGDLVPDYLSECRARNIFEVRIIHGKGIGNVKRSVHSILAKIPEVISFAEAGPHFGGSGATIVHLRKQ